MIIKIGGKFKLKMKKIITFYFKKLTVMMVDYYFYKMQLMQLNAHHSKHKPIVAIFKFQYCTANIWCFIRLTIWTVFFNEKINICVNKLASYFSVLVVFFKSISARNFNLKEQGVLMKKNSENTSIVMENVYNRFCLICI